MIFILNFVFQPVICRRTVRKPPREKDFSRGGCLLKQNQMAYRPFKDFEQAWKQLPTYNPQMARTVYATKIPT